MLLFNALNSIGFTFIVFDVFRRTYVELLYSLLDEKVSKNVHYVCAVLSVITFGFVIISVKVFLSVWILPTR